MAADKTLIVQVTSASCRISVAASSGALSDGASPARSIPIDFDRAIQEEIARRHHLLIGSRTAEFVKMGIADACPPEERLTMDVRGRDEASGATRVVSVTNYDACEAIHKSLEAVCAAILQVLAELPPAWAADIARNGIVLTGQGSQIQNLDRRLSEATGYSVQRDLDWLFEKSH